MERYHCFNCPGGDILSQIGASWFVIRSYWEIIDKRITDWNEINSVELRENKYKNSCEYHDLWLYCILNMDDIHLATNSLGYEGFQIKRMIIKILYEKRMPIYEKFIEYYGDPRNVQIIPKKKVIQNNEPVINHCVVNALMMYLDPKLQRKAWIEKGVKEKLQIEKEQQEFAERREKEQLEYILSRHPELRKNNTDQ